MMVWHYSAASAHLRSVGQSHLRRVMPPLLSFKDILAGFSYIYTVKVQFGWDSGISDLKDPEGFP